MQQKVIQSLDWPYGIVEPLELPDTLFENLESSDVEAVKYFTSLLSHLKALKRMYPLKLSDSQTAYNLGKIITIVEKIFKNGYKNLLPKVTVTSSEIATSVVFESSSDFRDYEAGYFASALFDANVIKKSYVQAVGNSSITTSWAIQVVDLIKERILAALPEEYAQELINCVEV